MKSKAKNATLTVVLRKRIILTDDIIFDAEREVRLPIQPFVGLRLYNSEYRPRGFDESEDRIDAIAYDFKTHQVICYFQLDDFREEASGADDWTEEEVRDYHRDWTLTQDDLGKKRKARSGTKGTSARR